MPVFGITESKQEQLGRGYELDPIKEYARSFQDTVESITREGIDYYRDLQTCFRIPSAKNALREFFVKDSFDEKDPEFASPQKMQEKRDEMNTLFENTIKAINEHTPLNTVNPMQGLTLPMYKNTLMNFVFDKGVIPKAVAAAPKFTRTMEERILIDTEGNKIDMYRDQDKIYDAMRSVNPMTNIELDLVQGCGSWDDIVTDKLNGSAKFDSLDISAYISGVVFDNSYKSGNRKPDGTDATGDETIEVTQNVELKFSPSYGEVQRYLAGVVVLNVHNKDTNTYKETKVKVHGSITDNVLTITTVPNNVIKKIIFKAKLDASNARLSTCSVAWGEKTDVVEIGTSEPISTTVSPMEIKDISALYNINQVTKIMSLTKTCMTEYKDKDIKNSLDESFITLPKEDRFFGRFDFAVREGYSLDHIEYRQRVFWDWLESQTTKMLQRLNDPNVTISVIGDPDLIRKIQPTEISYSSPSNIGPVEIDYSKTVYTSNKRHYTFVGSDKLRWEDELIITLCPRNSHRIIYIIYDYQMYFGNEIRQFDNPSLPALHAFQRYKFDKYQPVQARVQILNPSGLRPEESENLAFAEYTNPGIGVQAITR